MADLVVTGADLVATMDDERRELPGGWVAITDGLVEAVGSSLDTPPNGDDTLRRPRLPRDPRSHQHPPPHLPEPDPRPPAGDQGDAVRLADHALPAVEPPRRGGRVPVGLGRAGRAGPRRLHHHAPTTSTSTPRAAGDLITAEIAAATELGMRFHPTRGSMSLSQKDGGLPPDSVVQDDDEILADSERLVELHHDPRHGAMVRIALAPCSPFSVTPQLMVRTAELAERLDVRLHTHLAEDADEDTLRRASLRASAPSSTSRTSGWCTDRSWVAHCIYPNDAEIARLGAAGVGRGPLPELQHDDRRRRHRAGARAPGRRGAGRPRVRRLVVDRLGVAVDGGPQRHAPRAAAAGPGVDRRPRRPGDRHPRRRRRASAGPASWASCRSAPWATWCAGRSRGVAFAGAITDPIEAWLRCGPVAARHTVVAGRAVVRDGTLVSDRVEDVLAAHRRQSERLQAPT